MEVVLPPHPRHGVVADAELVSQQQDIGAFGQGRPDRAGPTPAAKGAQVLGGDCERGCDGRHGQSCRSHSSSVGEFRDGLTRWSIEQALQLLTRLF
jgi:hypothetical protein